MPSVDRSTFDQIGALVIIAAREAGALRVSGATDAWTSEGRRASLMNLLTMTIVFGLAACTLLVAWLFLLGRTNPRIMLQDYPPDVQAAVPPKTAQERRQTVFWAIPLFLLFVGFPVAAALTAKAAGAGFLTIALCAFGVGLVINLFDLLILDWLMFCTWTPKFVVLPGTEGMAGYKDFGLHFRGFLIGTVIFAVLSSISAGIVFVI